MSARRVRGSAARATICQRYLPRNRQRKQGAGPIRSTPVHQPCIWQSQSYFDLVSFSTFLMIVSISRMSTGRLGWVKLISGAGMRLCLMFGGTCL